MREKKIKSVEEAINLGMSFPHGYSDFSGGVDISDERIREFIKEGIADAVQKMKDEDLGETFFSISTGNVIVFGEVYMGADGLAVIGINVSRSYALRTVVDIDIYQEDDDD